MSRMQSIWEQRTERKRGRERGTLVAAAACALGALYRFPAIYPPLFHLSPFSLSPATGIQNCNTRICCHWNSSLFPITSEWKFPLLFTKCKRTEREKSGGTRNFIYFYLFLFFPFSEDKDICPCQWAECIHIWIQILNWSLLQCISCSFKKPTLISDSVVVVCYFSAVIKLWYRHEMCTVTRNQCVIGPNLFYRWLL